MASGAALGGGGEVLDGLGEGVQHDADRGFAVAAAAADGEDLAGDRLGRGQQPDPWGQVPGGEFGDQGGGPAGAAVFLGVAPSAAGFVLWAYAMSRMDVGRVTTSLYLVPAAARGAGEAGEVGGARGSMAVR
jgi:hypothetical protein